jgi:exonuclease VII small subunit
MRTRKAKNQMVERTMRTLDEILDEMKTSQKPLDEALESLTAEERKEYEEAVELWITYGGD